MPNVFVLVLLRCDAAGITVDSMSTLSEIEAAADAHACGLREQRYPSRACLPVRKSQNGSLRMNLT